MLFIFDIFGAFDCDGFVEFHLCVWVDFNFLSTLIVICDNDDNTCTNHCEVNCYQDIVISSPQGDRNYKFVD